jgi:Asp-tRNA(Asn)/Glu-tRNA(Gln) amidotransferase A subunit family amidase
MTAKTVSTGGVTGGLLLLLASGLVFAQGTFNVEEATIASTQKAIQDGKITCHGVVQAYIDRIKAYNGTCTALVTADGKPIAQALGIVRGGRPLSFPTKTVAASTFLPDLDKYQGLPLEYGRMEPTVSDPNVKQQFGMRVGIANAGQLNAIETLNIRGERSVSCKAGCDAATGSLPASCPKACDEFRKQPDALERAAELDKQYGTQPDLDKLPMYCVAFAWKNWYDAKDMRATGGNDVRFAMDAPKFDSPDVANMRAKGAISVAVANAAKAGGSAAGAEKPKSILLEDNLAYGAWGGQPCNPYDTTRVPRGSSSGSGVAISASFAACSFCEQTGGSCKGPASRNGIVNLLTTKGILMDGGYGYQKIGDRAGIHCRTVADAVKVLDAAKGFESADPYTALPRAIIPKEPYASFLVADGDVAAKPLKGMRIAVARSFMIKHTKNDAAIADQIDGEIKTVLRDKLGAELLEATDPKYPDDSSIPNLKYSFEDAFREILPSTVPEFFWQKDEDGQLEFAVPGWDVTSVKYLSALALGKAPLSPKINLRRIAKKASQSEGPLGWNRYLALRGDERVKDWASWVANSKFDSDEARAGAVNLANVKDARVKPDTISYLKMHTVLRMIVLKVMRENGIDAFVNPEQTTPPYKLGMASEPEVDWRESNGCCQTFTAMMGAPEMEVPAGFTEVTYDPTYVLSPDKKQYVATTGAVQTRLEHPMPISLMIWAGPGDEPAMIKIASAYEAAAHHRRPPPDFGPVAMKMTQVRAQQ